MMTTAKFRETNEGRVFVASADSRESSPEIMEAIAFFARDLAEAESVWRGDGEAEGICRLTDIWEYVTRNGRLDASDFIWGAAGNHWYTCL